MRGEAARKAPTCCPEAAGARASSTAAQSAKQCDERCHVQIFSVSQLEVSTATVTATTCTYDRGVTPSPTCSSVLACRCSQFMEEAWHGNRLNLYCTQKSFISPRFLAQEPLNPLRATNNCESRTQHVPPFSDVSSASSVSRPTPRCHSTMHPVASGSPWRSNSRGAPRARTAASGAGTTSPCR